MIADIVQSEIEKKMQKAKEGLALLRAEAPPFAFLERPLVRDEVIPRYQKGLDLFEEVRRTRAAHEAAVEAQRSALAGMQQFHAEAMTIARSHFGSDTKQMATFGVSRPRKAKRHPRRCRSEVGEEVVTTVVEAITTVSEQLPFESRVPRGEVRPPKLKCRVPRVPSRAPKPGCEAAKGCGSRVIRSGKYERHVAAAPPRRRGETHHGVPVLQRSCF